MDTRPILPALLFSLILLLVSSGSGNTPGSGKAPGSANTPDTDRLTPATSVPPVSTPQSGRLGADGVHLNTSSGTQPDASQNGQDPDSGQLGAFTWLTRPLQLSLRWIAAHWTAGNFGWAIVVLTLLIRLCLWPLTHRSMKHMKLMRELNPSVQALRKRFDKRLTDKQGRPNLEAHRELNEQVMAVYRQAGTTPVAGCFPMLLQFPVLVALYTLLRNAAELQGAAWGLWIQDLASPDPYYLLPILMGVTQLGQQLVTPMGMSPVQRRLVLLLPLVFTLFCLHAPSGLVLYWLTSNLFTLLQHRIYRQDSSPPLATSQPSSDATQATPA